MEGERKRGRKSQMGRGQVMLRRALKLCSFLERREDCCEEKDDNVQETLI